jgi:DNA mismatch repair protein MSH6
MRPSEAWSYEQTLKELGAIYGVPNADADDLMLGDEVPEAISSMLGCRGAIEALGGTVWCVRCIQLDICVYIFLYGYLYQVSANTEYRQGITDS